MRLGAVWVGINKILPEGDKRHILAHSGAKLLLTDSSLAAQVDALRGDTPDLAHVWMVDDAARDGGWTAAFAAAAGAIGPLDRKSVVEGKSVSVRVDPGGPRTH